jgi:hypothetical protein
VRDTSTVPSSTANAHFTAAAANLELSTNDADLNIIDRHRERPSGVVRDCEVRIAADNSRATLVLRDVEAELRLRTQHYARPIRQCGLAYLGHLRRNLRRPMHERQQIEGARQPRERSDSGDASRCSEPPAVRARR